MSRRTCLSEIPDRRGDGIADLLIGSYWEDPNGNRTAGASYTVIVGELVGKNGFLQLSDLDGSNGFVIYGVASSDQSGISVSAAGDLNADGIGVIVIGAFGSAPGDVDFSGAAYIIFGGRCVVRDGRLDLSELDGRTGVTQSWVGASDYTGISVSDASDFNNDGFDDVIIGAPFADCGGREDSGVACILSGRPSIPEPDSAALVMCLIAQMATLRKRRD